MLIGVKREKIEFFSPRERSQRSLASLGYDDLSPPEITYVTPLSGIWRDWRSQRFGVYGLENRNIIGKMRVLGNVLTIQMFNLLFQRCQQTIRIK